MSYDLQLQCKLNDGCQWQLFLLLLLFSLLLIVVANFLDYLKWFLHLSMQRSHKSINFLLLLLLLFGIITEAGQKLLTAKCAPSHEAQGAAACCCSLFHAHFHHYDEDADNDYHCVACAGKCLQGSFGCRARRVNYFRWGCKFYLLYYAWSVLPPKECKEEADKEREEVEGNWQRRCCHEICIHSALNFDINCV